VRHETVRASIMAVLIALTMALLALLWNPLVAGYFPMWDIEKAWIAYILSAFFIEGMLVYLVLRNFRFWYALEIVIVASLIESVFYALSAEAEAILFGVSIGTVWGVWFWSTLLIRFVYGGHVLFFILAVGITKATKRVHKVGTSTGMTINVFGWIGMSAVHAAWNISLVYPGLEAWFTTLAVALAACSLSILWRIGEFRRFTIYPWTRESED